MRRCTPLSFPTAVLRRLRLLDNRGFRFSTITTAPSPLTRMRWTNFNISMPLSDLCFDEGGRGGLARGTRASRAGRRVRVRRAAGGGDDKNARQECRAPAGRIAHPARAGT
jgi:hypothetical protein